MVVWLVLDDADEAIEHPSTGMPISSSAVSVLAASSVGGLVCRSGFWGEARGGRC